LLAFLIRRLTGSLAVLAIMSLVVFLLIGLMPGDPLDLLIAGNPTLTAADAARLRALYGLDQPLIDRYLAWAGQALSGDFGWSRSFSRPALEILGGALLNTLQLLVPALLLALGLAVPLGLMAAARPRGIADRCAEILALLSLSVPTFWLALLLIFLFAVELRWLPAGGGGDGTLSGTLAALALPVATLALGSLGHFLRFMRAAAGEAMTQDWVRTARAKGVPRRRLLWRHVLPAASLPLVTLVGLSVGALFSGALVTEILFRQLGMGRVLYDAIMGNDYNLALVGLLTATAATLAGNLLADLAYARLDPRIKLS
jgi:peptide/nickel transport system permease protein